MKIGLRLLVEELERLDGVADVRVGADSLRADVPVAVDSLHNQVLLVELAQGEVQVGLMLVRLRLDDFGEQAVLDQVVLVDRLPAVRSALVLPDGQAEAPRAPGLRAVVAHQVVLL